MENELNKIDTALEDAFGTDVIILTVVVLSLLQIVCKFKWAGICSSKLVGKFNWLAS